MSDSQTHTLLGSVLLLGLVLATSPRGVTQAPVLDWVQFGDEASEQGHAFEESGSVREQGGLGEPCRRIGADGYLRWTFDCDSDGPNYLTVKLWGSDIGPGQLYLYEGDERIGAYQSEWPELDNTGGHRGHDPVLPGRFFYSTYLLPEAMTQGKSQMVVTVGSTGQPTPYATNRREDRQEKLSRGIYRAYLGTDPFLVPLPDEQQGAAPEPQPPLEHADGQSALRFLRAKVDDAVDLFLSWQCYGAEWDAWVDEHGGPSELTGAFSIGGPTDASWTKAEFKDQLAARMGGNRVGLLLPEIFARAYHAERSRHYHRDELVTRVALALDYARLAQGSNGGFDDIWTHKWVGGPERRKAGNCLEGFGHMGLSAAFLLLRREIEAQGLLDELVDEDDDPDTPQVPRLEAWTRLFLESRNYLTSDIGRGHAPNQDMSDIIAAYLDDECLQLLAPEHSWPVETKEEYVHIACGLRKDIYGGYWISRKGVSCEPHGTSNGGYCGCYGDLREPLFRLARLTGDERVRERALEHAHTLARFRYPSLDAQHRPVIRREGVVTWRNNWTPGGIDYGGDPYAAVALGDELSLREIQLAAEQGGYFRLEAFQPGPYNVHLPAVTAGVMRELDLLAQALALTPTEARLPFEPGQPDFAWADEQAAVVVVKQGDTRLVMALNWRHGFGDKPGFDARSPHNGAANNLARVHCTTPAIERIANVRMESPQGFGGLYVCRYGPYLVLMNAGWSRLPEDAGGPVTFTMPEGLPAKAVNLVDGSAIDLQGKLTVSEETTLVLDLWATPANGD